MYCLDSYVWGEHKPVRLCTACSEYIILCFARWVSGSVEFIPIEYCYCEETNEIIRRTTYQAAENVAFPDVIVANCIDFVEVPRDIFEKLNKN